MARRRAKQSSALRLIVDSGAVLALARRDVRARAALAAAWEVSAEVIVPAVVVAETVRGHGARDAPVNRVLNAIGKVPATTEPTARTAGVLQAGAEITATIDALVVAEAVQRGGGVILTSDPDDLRRLGAGHPEVIIQPL